MVLRTRRVRCKIEHTIAWFASPPRIVMTTYPGPERHPNLDSPFLSTSCLTHHRESRLADWMAGIPSKKMAT